VGRAAWCASGKELPLSTLKRPAGAGAVTMQLLCKQERLHLHLRAGVKGAGQQLARHSTARREHAHTAAPDPWRGKTSPPTSAMRRASAARAWAGSEAGQV